MTYFKDKKILCISPHFDDMEISAGGTIHIASQNNCEIRHVILSLCGKSQPENYRKNPKLVEFEIKQANGILSTSIELEVYDFEVREFPNQRQEILEKLVDIQTHFSPDIVITTSPKDKHQDHKTVGEEVQRAFKNCTVLFAETPNSLLSEPSFFNKIPRDVLDIKLKALNAYKSQHWRFQGEPNLIESLARVRGNQSKVLYAEAFETWRFVE